MPVTPEQAAAWEAEGRRIAPALDPVATVIVAGADVDAAAHLALGLAAGQSARRRVAIADLTGEAAPLAALVPDDDPHGLGDTFAFGVSLNRVARQLDQDGRLFVVPAGSEPALRAELVDSDRWRRIVDGFRDVGALLLLVAPAAAPGLADLVTHVDGVVAADESDATAALPRRIITAELREPVMPGRGRSRRRAPVMTASRNATGPAPRRLRPLILTIIAAIVIAGLLWVARWFGATGDDRPLFTRSDSASAEIGAPVAGLPDRTGAPDAAARGADSGAPSLRVAAAPAAAANSGAPAAEGTPAASSLSPSPGTAGEAEAPVGPPPVANSGDSTRAAAFAVAVARATTEPAITAAFRGRSASLAAVTIGYATDSTGAPVYYVVSGAAQRRAAADASLGTLRRRGVIGDAAAAMVVRLPYALQVESSVASDSVRLVLNRFLARGIPAYALLQPNKRAHIYVGAFATPSDARPLLATLQAAAVPAALAVRTGRPM